MSDETFGAMLKRIRKEHNIPIGKAAKAAGISTPYLSDIEKDRRPAPARDKLMEMFRSLNFTKDEEAQLCDAAGRSQNTIAYDLPEYIMDRDYVTVALRTAKDMDAGEEVWKKFVDELLASKGSSDDSRGVQ